MVQTRPLWPVLGFDMAERKPKDRTLSKCLQNAVYNDVNETAHPDLVGRSHNVPKAATSDSIGDCIPRSILNLRTNSILLLQLGRALLTERRFQIKISRRLEQKYQSNLK